MKSLFVAIEGIIGVGKSLFARVLASKLPDLGHLGAYAQFEPVDTNPYLALFYADMKRWALTLQLHLLHVRYRMHQQAAVSDVTVVQDRSIYGDVCFARLATTLWNMTDDEMATYNMARENMMLHAIYPDIVIYLDISATQAHRRIQQRVQTGDSSIPLSYLEGLKTEYESMIESLGRHCPVFRVGWSDFSDEEIAERVVDTWASASARIRDDWTRRQGW